MDKWTPVYLIVCVRLGVFDSSSYSGNQGDLLVEIGYFNKRR